MAAKAMEVRNYGVVPSAASLELTPFRVKVSDAELERLQILLKHSRVTPTNFENTRPDREFGVNRDWIADRVRDWQTSFNWGQYEDRLNAIPQFRTTLPFRNGVFGLHFLALFSRNEDAPAVLLTYGSWSSLIELLPFCETLKTRYTPDTLPFHVIIPSTPGGGFSDRPPIDNDFTVQDIAKLYDTLMAGLGLTKEYITLGNDLGFWVSRQLAAYDSCRGVLTHLFRGQPNDQLVEHDATDHDLKRRQWFISKSSAYVFEYSTRLATIGLVLASDPVGLLAWLSEKYLDFTHPTPSNDDILAQATLQWFTNSLPTTTSVYGQLVDPAQIDVYPGVDSPVQKPFGYAYYPQGLNPVRRDYLEAHGDLVFYHEHEKGGHFPLWEVPLDVLDDIEAFLAIIYSDKSK